MICASGLWVVRTVTAALLVGGPVGAGSAACATPAAPDASDPVVPGAMSQGDVDRLAGPGGRLPVRRAVDLRVPGAGSWAEHVSDRGVVIGGARGDDGRYHAFRWQAGAAVLLPEDGYGSMAGDVNVHGQVAGSVTTQDGRQRTVVWEPDGTVVEIAAPPEHTVPWDIDDTGRVAVNWHDPGSGMPRAAVWEDGRLTLLGDLGGGTSQVAGADALNNRGLVVGTAVTADDRRRAFVWRDGVMTALPAPATADAYAEGVTARGDVVGQIADPAGRSGYVVWEKGRLRYLDLQGGYLVGVNDRGAVAGNVTVGDGTYRGIVAGRRGTLQLTTLGGPSAGTGALSNLGVVVGWAERTGDTAPHPVAWVRGRVVPLGEQLPGLTIRGGMASDINESGQVVGHLQPVTGPDPSDYTQHAVLWELVPRR